MRRKMKIIEKKKKNRYYYSLNFQKDEIKARDIFTPFRRTSTSESIKNLSMARRRAVSRARKLHRLYGAGKTGTRWPIGQKSSHGCGYFVRGASGAKTFRIVKLNVQVVVNDPKALRRLPPVCERAKEERRLVALTTASFT